MKAKPEFFPLRLLEMNSESLNGKGKKYPKKKYCIIAKIWEKFASKVNKF
ncbi:MAG TPA: hypothetical protein GXX36_14240 [Clostridiaceae bacterium]|nr:hypothetical protein [Clostridiaceae bacterium]